MFNGMMHCHIWYNHAENYKESIYRTIVLLVKDSLKLSKQLFKARVLNYFKSNIIVLAMKQSNNFWKNLKAVAIVHFYMLNTPEIK